MVIRVVDEGQTREQLLAELAAARRRGAELLALAAGGAAADVRRRAPEDILERILDAVVTTDMDFTIRTWNRAAEELYGWRADEVIGQRFAQITRLEYGSEPPEAIIREIMTRSCWSGETGQHRRDGTVLHVWSRVSLLRDADDHPAGLVAVNRDVSHRRRAEDELRRRSHELDERVKELRCLYGISALVERNGPLDELLAGVAALIPPAWQHPESTCARVVLNGQEHRSDRFEERPWKLSSPIRIHGEPAGSIDVCYLGEPPEEAAADPFLQEEQELLEAVAERVGRIVERRQAEQALEQSEAKHRSLFANMLNGFAFCRIITDTAGRPVDWTYLEVNDAFERLTGLKRQDVVGKRVTEAIPGIVGSEPNLFEIYGRVALTGESTRLEIFFAPLEIWLAIAVYCPEPGYFVAVFDNITERKRAEEERVTLREQLHQAQKMEALGRLAGGVAHDFNNLLCIIKGHAALGLYDLPAGDPLHESLKEITKAAARGADLTKQLLAFSRKQVIAPKVIDLNHLIASLHPMLVRLLGEDIILRTVPQKGLGAVRVDPGQVEQIVLNLAINARDAMPEGGELVIETADVVLDEDYCRKHALATPGPFVMLAVSDTGCGMSAEIREKIFEPFYTTKQPGRGTGLGLATVFGIVQQSGGRIEVYSEPGQGSSFKVYFPRVAGAGERLSRSEPPAPSRGRETVLVVEDDAMVRTLAVRILRRLGYEVLAAGSGGEALVLAESHASPIDLLLTDVVMPHMNGRELANRLTAVRPHLKVLYASGYTNNVIVHHGVLDDGVQLIAKPYSLETLGTKVREVLNGPGGTKA